MHVVCVCVCIYFCSHMFVDAALCTPGWCARSSSRLRRLAQRCLTGGAMRLLLLPRYVNIIYMYVYMNIYTCTWICTGGALRLLPLPRYVHFIYIYVSVFLCTRGGAMRLPLLERLFIYEIYMNVYIYVNLQKCCHEVADSSKECICYLYTCIYICIYIYMHARWKRQV